MPGRKKVRCIHVWKVGPGRHGECSRFKIEGIDKGFRENRNLPKTCTAEAGTWEVSKRICCWYCPLLSRCPHPTHRCEDARLLMKNKMELGLLVEGVLE